jgi:hypothetical protein
VGATAPDLVDIKESNPPPGTTLYFKINLNITPDAKALPAPKPLTGVFVPQKYAAGSELKILVWLHGHHEGTTTIDEYWTRYHSPKYQIRHTLNDSNLANFVLAAPSLAGDSTAGDLIAAGGLEDYVGTVLAGLKKHAAAKFATLPPLQTVVVGAHSGGGRPMLVVAEKLTTSTFDQSVKEFWGFDCLYDVDSPYDMYKDPPVKPYGAGHTDPRKNTKPAEVRWFKWAKGGAKAKLTMRHATDEPTTRCLNLKRLCAGDKFPAAPSGKDGWEEILGFDGGTPASGVTVTASAEKGHEEMVKPNLLKQLTGSP